MRGNISVLSPVYMCDADTDLISSYYDIRCLAVSPNFEIAKNNMAIALTDLGTKVIIIL